MPADIDYFTEYKMNDKNHREFSSQLPGYLKEYFQKALIVFGKNCVLQGYRGPQKFLEKDASGDSEFLPSSSGIQEIKFRYGLPKLLAFTVFLIFQPVAAVDLIFRNKWGSLYFESKTGQILSNDKEQAKQKLKQKIKSIQIKKEEQRIREKIQKEKQLKEQRQRQQQKYLKQEAQRKAREIEQKEKKQKEMEERIKEQKQIQNSLMKKVQIEMKDSINLSRLIGRVESHQNLSPELMKMLDRLYDKRIQRDIKNLNIEKAKLNYNLMQERRNKINHEKLEMINQLEQKIRIVKSQTASQNKEDLINFHQYLTMILQDETYAGGVGLLALQRLVKLRIDRRQIESLILALKNKQNQDLYAKKQLIQKMQANIVQEEKFSEQFGFLFSEQGKSEIKSQIKKIKALKVKLDKIQLHKNQQVFTEMSIEMRQLQKNEQTSVDKCIIEKMMKEQVEALEK